MITGEVLIARNEELMTTAIDGDFVMMSIETGKYYGLNSVSSRIWELIEEAKNINAICGLLQEEYEISAERCNDEVTRLLEKMLEQGIIKLF